MTEKITYAKLGGPPDDWANIETIDLDKGETVEGVIEVNSDCGWLVRKRYDPLTALYGGGLVEERIKGRFYLRRMAG